LIKARGLLFVKGHEAVFLEINTLGEESFLQKAVEIIKGYSAGR
jgi:hypothetical protein